MGRGMRAAAAPLTAILLIVLIVGLASTSLSALQEPCAGVLGQGERQAQVLPGVPLYTTTYTLVFPDRLAEEIPTVDAPALKTLSVGVYDGSPAVAVAAELGLENVRRSAFDPARPGQIVAAVLAQELDAGIVWAPLAGLAVLELDLDYELSLKTAGPPSSPPPAFAAPATAEPGPCATEISSLLEGYGVVPAQQLVPVDIRDFLSLEAPAPNLHVARQGVDLYAEHCAKCHGPQAVADRTALAPVDLLRSIRRFTYPGFTYIALNGRAQNGMPGFRGKLGQEELVQIYQYVRARSQGEIEPTLPLAPAQQGDG